MSHSFPKQQFKWTRPLSVGGALILTAALFWIIPLTQNLNTPTKPDLNLREMTLGKPQKKETPPPLEPKVPQKKSQPKLEIAQKTTPIDIQPLDIDISPGYGDAIAIGAPLVSARSADELFEGIQELFSFNDLAETPRLINAPSFQYPSSLKKRGVNRGKVIVEIDILPNGSAELRRIVSSSHPEFESIAKKIIKNARFTPPTVNGEPQRVRGRFPIILEN
jgi:TonB family protein